MNRLEVACSIAALGCLDPELDTLLRELEQRRAMSVEVARYVVREHMEAVEVRRHGAVSFSQLADCPLDRALLGGEGAKTRSMRSRLRLLWAMCDRRLGQSHNFCRRFDDMIRR
mgnify:CR=1 FL=1